MAGSLPDVPGYRFLYESDGTIGINYPSSLDGVITTMNNTVLSNINSDSSPDVYNQGHQYWTLVFPELRTISGYFIRTNSASPTGGFIIATSTDTINGRDGTWSIRANPYVRVDQTTTVSPAYRQYIQPVDWQNIRAIRVNSYHLRPTIHYYGSISPTESPNRLRIIDASDNDIAAQFDFGDIYQRSNVTKQFKVLNNSSAQTASNITVTVSANPYSDASPTLVGQFQVSTDNIAFANAVNIGSLAPNTSSDMLYVKDTVASNAQLGPWTARITASAVSWS